MIAYVQWGEGLMVPKGNPGGIKCGQKIGVGYPKSKNNLFREINRGVEWIFCNDAVRLSGILRTELKKLQLLADAKISNE